MADSTIIATADTELLEAAGNRSTRVFLTLLNQDGGSNVASEPVIEFDVSSVAGTTWDSVVLRLTYNGSDSTGSGSATIKYILKPVVITTCTYALYDTALSWATPGARTSADSDAATAITDFTLAGGTPSGTRIETPDLTAMVNKALAENSGILSLLIHWGGGAHQFHSLEATADESAFPQLFFSNISEAPTGGASSSGDGAVADAAPSASVQTQSARPPVTEAGRQVTASVLNDGVLPMTILSLIVKGTFGTDT